MDNTICFDTLYNQPLPKNFQGYVIFFYDQKYGLKWKKGKLWNLLIKSLEQIFLMYFLGVFQFVKDILQSTVFLDHPVGKKNHKKNYLLQFSFTSGSLLEEGGGCFVKETAC